MLEEKKETVTRATIAAALNRKVGVPNSVACEVTDCFFEQIIKSLTKEDTMKISKFGSFYRRFKNKRVGRNPKTKEEAEISARNSISFYASSFLKNRINK